MNEPFSLPTLGMIIATVVLAVAAAIVLNRMAGAKKKFLIENLTSKSPETSSLPDFASVLREKLEQLPIRVNEREGTLQFISKVVEEETEQRLKELKQEYSVKHQVMVQEKNKEVNNIKIEHSETLKKYEDVKREYKRVNLEKKNTEAVVKSIAEGLVVVNQNGEVLLMNPAAKKLLGAQGEKKIGTSILEGLGNECLVSMSHKSDGSDEQVVEYTSKDESIKKVIRASTAVIQNEEGQTIGMMNVLTDVTKQKELDEIKTRFVSNVTHELRTPIVAMQKSVEILMDSVSASPNQVQSNFINIIHRNLLHLSRLVEDLLDIAKIESGQMRLKFAAGSLEQLLNEACDTLDTWAKSKEITLRKDFDKTFPKIIMDSVKITQVLNNLISNAIKFTPRGGEIFVSSAWNDASSVKVCVADTGVGIAKENLPKLFGRFEQFGDQQGITGTGLGLCISKEIVTRHAGKISAESEEKKGTQFTFILPLKQPAATESL